MADASTSKGKKRKAPQSGQGAARRPAPARSSRPAARRGGRREDDNGPTEPKTSFKGIFAKDLGDIMYGFGDSTNHPVPETVDAIEAIAVDFVKDLISKCLHNVSIKGKIDVPDIQFVLRKDVPKAQRAMELVVAKERTKKFKSVEKIEDFDVEDIQDSVQVHDEGWTGHEAPNA